MRRLKQALEWLLDQNDSKIPCWHQGFKNLFVLSCSHLKGGGGGGGRTEEKENKKLLKVEKILLYNICYYIYTSQN